MEVKKETRPLHPHKMVNQKVLSKRTCQFIDQKVISTWQIQYTLLVYQLYNLIGHRFSLLYEFGKLDMITSRTHAIAKNTYLGPRPVRLDQTKSLRYTIPRSFSQVLGKLLRDLL